MPFHCLAAFRKDIPIISTKRSSRSKVGDTMVADITRAVDIGTITTCGIIAITGILRSGFTGAIIAAAGMIPARMAMCSNTDAACAISSVKG